MFEGRKHNSEWTPKVKERKEKVEIWGKIGKKNKMRKYNTRPKKPITLKRQIAQATSQIPSTYMDVAPVKDEKFLGNIDGFNWFSSDNINYAMFILSRQYSFIDGLGN